MMGRLTNSVNVAVALSLLATACDPNSADLAPGDEAQAEFPTPEVLGPVGKADGIERPTLGDEGLPIGDIDGYSEPSIIDPDFERSYAALPLEGQAAQVPWTDDYWRKNRGGISYRWQTGESYDYRSPDRATAQQMSADELAKLSPTEKYDLYVGAYDYPLTDKVKTSNRRDESDWQGYCHGWTPAAIHYDEPNPVTMTNPDGIEVPFGSTDVKALLTYFQGEVLRSAWSDEVHPFRAETRAIGTECSGRNAAFGGCYDVNPGAFHIVMANEVGLRQRGFGIDVDTTYEKWNQPVYAYDSREVERRPAGSSAAADAVEEVVINTRMDYVVEIHPQWEPEPGSSLKTKDYWYTLELDAKGEIVGGEWLLRLESGALMTYEEVYQYFATIDEDGDGVADYDRDRLFEAVMHYFDYPDYVWWQDAGDFSPTFQMANKWTLFGLSPSVKTKTYHYMAKLADIYDEATR